MMIISTISFHIIYLREIRHTFNGKCRNFRLSIGPAMGNGIENDLVDGKRS
jgi:hypothetical protein